MIALAALLLQAAPLSAPAPAAVRAASPRALSGRFGCDGRSYELAITASAAAPVRLDRLALDGRPVDQGSYAEVSRLVARLSDVQSLDVRCRGDGAELLVYGTVRPAAGPRRARLRGEWRDGRLSALALGVIEQR